MIQKASYKGLKDKKPSDKGNLSNIYVPDKEILSNIHVSDKEILSNIPVSDKEILSNKENLSFRQNSTSKR